MARIALNDCGMEPDLTQRLASDIAPSELLIAQECAWIDASIRKNAARHPGGAAHIHAKLEPVLLCDGEERIAS